MNSEILEDKDYIYLFDFEINIMESRDLARVFLHRVAEYKPPKFEPMF